MLHAPHRSGYRAACRLLAFSLLCPSALAATGVSVDVSRVELSVQPGASVNHAVTVSNPGTAQDSTMKVSTYLRDFVFPASGDVQFLGAGSTRNSLSKWLQFTPPEFILAAGQKQQIRYTVQVPAGTAPGLYWGVLFFKSDTDSSVASAAPPSPASGVTVTYNIDVGQIIYVQVGSPTLNASLSTIGAEYANGQLNVSASIKNTGNALLRAAGRAQVIDANGQIVTTLPIGESVALPGYTRAFSGQAPATLKAGEYQVLLALQYAKGKVFTGQTRLVVK